MKENETIVEMITRFTDIVNGLESLGKTYKESEKVMKILRLLPSKWHTKVTAIQEAKDLTKLPMEELIGSLMTYEINLAKKLQDGEDKKKKSIAFKATTKEEEDVEKEKPSEENDDLALITRKLNKYMRGERFKGRKFTSRRDFSKKESSSHGDKDKWEEKRDLMCFKCKKSGHIKYDCLLYKSEAKRRMKKAMMATWSESEESSEEEKEKEVANMCFMAIDELDEESIGSNGARFGVETKKLWPFEDDCAKLNGNVAAAPHFATVGHAFGALSGAQIIHTISLFEA
ncbi:hypothetical protein VitviT2T_004175 [Vitis vinifera]|uniref:CCHC-type domain-containing protein n=1 Tax=Vitis vinifera TaxID=29760 RepID=A0ABY9BQM9_VITVI|nr:hypothetical protein VitviT2T_004175 [Vitis vinifera]